MIIEIWFAMSSQHIVVTLFSRSDPHARSLNTHSIEPVHTGFNLSILHTHTHIYVSEVRRGRHVGWKDVRRVRTEKGDRETGKSICTASEKGGSGKKQQMEKRV